ncbi:hypothetical protein B7R78_0006910 [Ralstonia solanacearum]|uniref:hypothetical protein n=1 Tax=Ralstonia solanacearum TaxID=305 RepID=UPI0011414734|nr:hypothetical protein [Ralstonia solanacearum]MBT1536861.1 hypothetical protein [Ralstonia solanacearum]
MKRPEDLIVGRIYFSLLYEDEEFRYPRIHSYEYRGLDEKREGRYRFRCVDSSNDFVSMKEEDLEMIEDTGELVDALSEWARQNPDLAS